MGDKFNRQNCPLCDHACVSYDDCLFWRLESAKYKLRNVQRWLDDYGDSINSVPAKALLRTILTTRPPAEENSAPESGGGQG